MKAPAGAASRRRLTCRPPLRLDPLVVEPPQRRAAAGECPPLVFVQPPYLVVLTAQREQQAYDAVDCRDFGVRRVACVTRLLPEFRYQAPEGGVTFLQISRGLLHGDRGARERTGIGQEVEDIERPVDGTRIRRGGRDLNWVAFTFGRTPKKD